MFLVLKKHLPRCIVRIVQSYIPCKPKWVYVPIIKDQTQYPLLKFLKGQKIFKWIKVS